MDKKFGDHSKAHLEEILQLTEEYYEELLKSIKDLRLPLSAESGVPKAIMSLNDEINNLLSFEEKNKQELTLYQYYRLCKLLGRFYKISVDYSLWSKTQKRLHKYYSRALYYLRLTLEYPNIEAAEKIELQVETGIICIRFAWTFQGSTSDPVERLANNVRWSEFISDDELYELISDAKKLLAESLGKGNLELSKTTLTTAWEYLGLAQSLLAKTPDEHLISADAYLHANQHYLAQHLTTESFRAVMHACLEYSKAGEWNRTIECFETFLNYGDHLGEDSKTVIKNLLDIYCLVSSELAISLSKQGRLAEAMKAYSYFSSPLIASWCLNMRNAKSLEQGLEKAKEEFVNLAYQLIEDDALSKLDFSGTSWSLERIFKKKGKTNNLNQSHWKLLNSYNNVPLGKLRLDPGTVLIELICGHNETIAFLTNAGGDVNVISLPKLGLSNVQDQLVTFDNGELQGGLLANYTKFLASQRPNSLVNSNDPFTEFLLEPLDNMLMWLDESFAQPLRDVIAKLDNSSTIEKIILIPGAPLGFMPLHGACHNQNEHRKYLLDDFSISYCPNDALLRLELRNYKHSTNLHPFLLSFMDEKATTFFMELEALWATNILRPQKSYAIKFREAPSDKDWKAWHKIIDPVTHLLVSSHGISDLKRPLINSGFFLGKSDSSNYDVMRIAIDLLKDFNFAGGTPNPNINLIDLAKLPLLNCEFAFLGACESAMSTSLPTADNGLSPATVLLLSGVKNVVASMWLANDVANSFLFKELFTNISNGFSCDSALRGAQKKLRNTTWLEIRNEINSAVNMDIASRVVGRDLDDSKLHVTKPFEHPWFWIGYQSWTSQTR